MYHTFIPPDSPTQQHDKRSKAYRAQHTFSTVDVGDGMLVHSQLAQS